MDTSRGKFHDTFISLNIIAEACKQGNRISVKLDDFSYLTESQWIYLRVSGCAKLFTDLRTLLLFVHWTRFGFHWPAFPARCGRNPGIQDRCPLTTFGACKEPLGHPKFHYIMTFLPTRWNWYLLYVVTCSTLVCYDLYLFLFLLQLLHLLFGMENTQFLVNALTQLLFIDVTTG